MEPGRGGFSGERGDGAGQGIPRERLATFPRRSGLSREVFLSSVLAGGGALPYGDSPGCARGHQRGETEGERGSRGPSMWNVLLGGEGGTARDGEEPMLHPSVNRRRRFLRFLSPCSETGPSFGSRKGLLCGRAEECGKYERWWREVHFQGRGGRRGGGGSGRRGEAR